MQDKDLTEKQLHWLDASKKIGPGSMTKTERTQLERLYADMEPREQQDLYRYIEEKFGMTEPEKGSASEEANSDDPISRMQKKMWHQPSRALKSALSSVKRTTPPGR